MRSDDASLNRRNVIANVVPLPTSDSTAILPPCPEDALTRHRPRPVPFALVVKNGLKQLREHVARDSRAVIRD